MLSLVKGDAIRGTNLAGWMTLKPMVTPSLFYQFLDKTKTEGVAVDTWTFCEVKGPVEGNRWMREHWNKFINRTRIEKLAQSGVKRIRLQIGDWTLNQYGPYKGCMDGAEQQIDWMFDTCSEFGIDILLIVEETKKTANGFYEAGHLKWLGEKNFTKIVKPDWMGEWNTQGLNYTFINYSDLKWSLKQSEAFLKKWGTRGNLIGFEPVNNIAYRTDIKVLKTFYRQVRKLVQRFAPQAYFVFNDAQVYNTDWNDLFEDGDHDMVALDHHAYAAKSPMVIPMNTAKQVCTYYMDEFAMAAHIKYEVWVGEWSLGTDNCNLWFDGFQTQSQPWYFPCNITDMPESYMDSSFNTSYDKTLTFHFPYGDGSPDQAGMHFNAGWFDSALYNVNDIHQIAQCVKYYSNKYLNSTFFYTARMEFEAEKRWDYQLAFDEGWLNFKDIDENTIIDQTDNEYLDSRFGDL